MEQLHLIDTCIFISAFRKDKNAISTLKELQGNIAISFISQMELMRGARTAARKNELTKQFEVYSVIYLNERICRRSEGIMQKYLTGTRDIHIADCLLAATAIEFHIPFVTINKKDFDFIEGLELIIPW